MENLKNKLHSIEKNKECIILLHGLARTNRSMSKAETILSSYGYKTFNVNYPSRKMEIKQIAEHHLSPIIKKCVSKDYKKIHFLSHSMGGVLLRFYLSTHSIQNLGNTVMFSPPNKGSEVVDKFGHLRLFYLLNGPAGCQLGTKKNSVPAQLEKIDFSAGIIMGNKTINPLLSLLIPGENDGKVSVERAKIEGMHDFLLLPYSHSFIMQRLPAIYQALFFIQYGNFFR